MYIFTSRSILVCLYVVVHNGMPLMSSFLLLPAEPSMSCSMSLDSGRRLADATSKFLQNTYHPKCTFIQAFTPSVQIMLPYNSTKHGNGLERGISFPYDRQFSVVVHAFPMHM